MLLGDQFYLPQNSFIMRALPECLVLADDGDASARLWLVIESSVWNQNDDELLSKIITGGLKLNREQLRIVRVSDASSWVNQFTEADELPHVMLVFHGRRLIRKIHQCWLVDTHSITTLHADAIAKKETWEDIKFVLKELGN
jgi:hypothetical protein